MRFWIVRILTITGVFLGMFFLSRIVTDNLDSYYYQILIQCGIFITLAVSLNLI